MGRHRAPRLARGLAAVTWSYVVWLVLTWTTAPEQLVFGALLAVVVGAALASLGPVVGPWRLLEPRRAWAVLTLTGYALRRIVVANLELARRIWSPSRPLSSGMIVVATDARTDGEVAASGLISSLIVDNQIIDLDRSRRLLQYHAVVVPEGKNREDAVNAPIERRVRKVSRP